MTAPLLTIENLIVAYPAGRGSNKHTVSDVNLQINTGESLGLVGESGCGKTSIARAVMGFITTVSGRILFGRHDLLTLDKQQLRRLRPRFQMIFQDSLASFNPRRTIGSSIANPLMLLGIQSRTERIKRACEMMERVGLDPSGFHLYPHQLSGGQCQRAQIARALITRPELLVCDEPVSSLDALVRAQIIRLLDELRQHARVSMLLISHDLSVVRKICRRVAVMHAGKICELSDCGDLFRRPQHPYSRTLLEAIPKIGQFKGDGTAAEQAMEDNSGVHAGHGCSYQLRCGEARELCRRQAPLLALAGPDRYVACHFPLKKEHPS